MKLIVTITVRPEDLVGINLPTIDGSTTAAAKVVYEKVEPHLGYNRLVIDSMRGYKVEGFKLVRSGKDLKNLKLTIVFNDKIETSAPGCKAYLNMFRSLMAKRNLWAIALYNNTNGSTGLAFQNRANAVDKHGQAKPVKAITL